MQCIQSFLKYASYMIVYLQKSTLGSDWGSSSKSSSGSSGAGSGSSAGSGDSGSHWKYVVHKQPLSLDRFFIHEVVPQEAGTSAAKLEHAFVIICLNRFQQIVQVHTFQAENEQTKVNLTTFLWHEEIIIPFKLYR